MAGGTTRLAAVCIGSAVVLLRTIILCDDTHCKDYHGWALACSVISMVICLTVLLMMRFCPSCDVASYMKYIVLFLLLWWIGGTGAMTFERPYRITGNGYFGAWLALVASWQLTVEHWPIVKEPFEKVASAGGSQWFAILLLASFVVMVQASVDCDDCDDCCKDELAWVLSCSVISIVILLVVLFLHEKVSQYWKWIALFLFVWWAAGAGVGTFENPYKATGNGYFGCWAAVISAAVLTAQAFGKELGDSPGDALQRGADNFGGEKEIFAICLASLVCLIAAAIECDDRGSCKDCYGWTIACAVISFVLTLVILICLKMGWAAGQIKGAMKWIALFLAVWWFAGIWCMTFDAVFRYTGNGYFSSWVALIFAFILCMQHFPLDNTPLKKVTDKGKPLAILLLASLVVGIQGAYDCDQFEYCKKQRVWAVVCGWISFAIVIVCLFDCVEPWFKWIALFLLLWWTAGVGVLTFDRFWLITGNGYFAAWAAFLAAFLVARQHFGFLSGGEFGKGSGGGASGGGAAAPAGGALGGGGSAGSSPKAAPQGKQGNVELPPESPTRNDEPQNPMHDFPRGASGEQQQQGNAPPPPPGGWQFQADQKVQVQWDGSWHHATIWQPEQTPGTYTILWDDGSHSQGIQEQFIKHI